MKPTTKLKLESLIRRLIKEETSDDNEYVLTIARKLLDAEKRNKIGLMQKYEDLLKTLGVFDKNGILIDSHPLSDEVEKILS